MTKTLLRIYLRNFLREKLLEKLIVTILFSIIFFEVWSRIYPRADQIFVLVFLLVNIASYDAIFSSLLNHFKNELSFYQLIPCNIKKVLWFKLLLILLLWSANIFSILSYSLVLHKANLQLLFSNYVTLMPWIICAALLSSASALTFKSSSWAITIFNLLALGIVILAFRITTFINQIVFFLAGIIMALIAMSGTANAARNYEWR